MGRVFLVASGVLSHDPEIAPFANPYELERDGNFSVVRETDLKPDSRQRLASGSLARQVSAELSKHFALHEYTVSAVPPERNWSSVPVLTSDGRVEEQRIGFSPEFAPEGKLAVVWRPSVHDRAAPLVNKILAPHLRARR